MTGRRVVARGGARPEVGETVQAEVRAPYDLYREAEELLAARDAVSAVPLLRQAARRLPGERAIERLLGLALFGASSFGEAEPVLQGLVEASPLDADARHLLGRTLEALGRTGEAQAHLVLAGRLSPAYAVSCRTWAGSTEQR